ncbi:ATP-dependent DNA helicase [Altericista sp. CCNU0014]|uniref:ATP-dependent DNA helicase n=1 Tax=Altericista sp. CCNU0014 TaxID=3082949 RepID=UPI0038511AF7
MIEVEVHQQLRALLRAQGGNAWPHHLTVARLVARALRLQRSTLMQIGSTAAYQGQHRLSYLASLLLWPEPLILVASAEVQHSLCHVELPRLRDWLGLTKPVCLAQTWPDPNFSGIALFSPQDWLQHRLPQHAPLPPGVPVAIDGAESLEDWTRAHLTQTLLPQDWDALLWAYPTRVETIRDARAALTHTLFRHPPNPYGCLIVAEEDRRLLGHLVDRLQQDSGQSFSGKWQQFTDTLLQPNTLVWAVLDRSQGSFSLNSAPIEVASALQPLWEGRTQILLNGVVDLDAQSEQFQLQLGLADLTCVQFATDRHNEALSLYLPDGVPMPNTPEFAPALMRQLQCLLTLGFAADTFSALIIDDLPLKSRIASTLAAEFGSRVKVEKGDCQVGDVLISGWTFWLEHRRSLPYPNLMAIATLPFPSLENPKVAGRVAYYKQQRQDWFRLYLLPEALRILQEAIAPLRSQSSLLALFDSRVLHRTYGQQVLTALGPYARLNYLDESILIPPQCSV